MQTLPLLGKEFSLAARAVEKQPCQCGAEDEAGGDPEGGGVEDEDHACVSSGAGYKSGRSSWRGTPEMRSTSRTRSAGTRGHWLTADLVTPSAAASLEVPPWPSASRSLAFPESAFDMVSIANPCA